MSILGSQSLTDSLYQGFDPVVPSRIEIPNATLGNNIDWGQAIAGLDWAKMLDGFGSMGNNAINTVGNIAGKFGGYGKMIQSGANLFNAWNSYKGLKLAEDMYEDQRKVMYQDYENRSKKLNDEVRRRNMVGSVSGFGKTGAGGRYVKESLV